MVNRQRERMVSGERSRSERVAGGGLLQASLLAAAAAVLGNALVYALCRGVLQMQLMVPAGLGSTERTPLGLWQIAFVCAIAAFAATALLAFLTRLTSRPLRAFWILSVVMLSVSFVPVLVLPADTSTKLVLGLMHVVAAVAIVGVLTALLAYEQ